MAYIGSAEDSRRIRKQQEEREKQKLEFERRKKEGESNVDGAGLRQFGAAKTDVMFSTRSSVHHELIEEACTML